MRKLLLTTATLISVILSSHAQNYTYDELDINNIRTRFFANGNLFGGEITGNAVDGFEVPIGSGNSTMYSAKLWIGGVDVNGHLHLAAERYNQIGQDFFSGPLTTDGAASCIIGIDSVYNHVWKINKSTIDSFIQVSNHSLNIPGYIIPDAILNWPSEVAPFYDAYGDGNYNPQMFGDYPKIRGDQALFFVFNDKCGLHTESGGDAIGLEIRGMAYAFNCPQDSALANTIFVHYEIINRGSLTLNNTYVGLWSDMDIGYALDDYIQCDVMRGSYFTYNGANIDGSGGLGQYGAHPPAQSVTFLAGPYQDINDVDDEVGIGVDESINGFGFGDGIIDNERLGLSHFMYNNNIGGSGPQPANYYYSLKGYNDMGIPLYYGSGVDSIPARYMFPGDSDQEYFFGTNGVPVPSWTEETSGNVPYDRRSLGSSGPFTLEPGEVNPIDIAFVFGRDYNGGPQESIGVMKDRIDAIRTMFFTDSTTCGGSISSVMQNTTVQRKVSVYPNPAKDLINIACYNPEQNLIVELFNINGQKVLAESFGSVSSKIEIDVSKLKSGIYLLRISSENEIIHLQKIIKN